MQCERVLSYIGVTNSLLACGETEGQSWREQLSQARSVADGLAHHLGLGLLLHDAHLMLHYKVIEVASWVDGTILVKAALLHEIVDLDQEVSSHL